MDLNKLVKENAPKAAGVAVATGSLLSFNLWYDSNPQRQMLCILYMIFAMLTGVLLSKR